MNISKYLKLFRHNSILKSKTCPWVSIYNKHNKLNEQEVLRINRPYFDFSLRRISSGISPAKTDRRARVKSIFKLSWKTGHLIRGLSNAAGDTFSKASMINKGINNLPWEDPVQNEELISKLKVCEAKTRCCSRINWDQPTVSIRYDGLRPRPRTDGFLTSPNFLLVKKLRAISYTRLVDHVSFNSWLTTHRLWSSMLLILSAVEVADKGFKIQCVQK